MKKQGKASARAVMCMAMVVALIVFGGCAETQGRSSDEGSEKQQGSAVDVTFQWEPESNCSMCHEKEARSTESSLCQISTSHATIACLTCHADVSSLKKAHEEVDASDTGGARWLSQTEVTKEVCQACHESAPDVEATASVMVLTDENGKTVNPHDLPSNKGHAGITCANCHQMHAEEPIAETAAAACLKCHHKNVYECNTCHE